VNHAIRSKDFKFVDNRVFDHVAIEGNLSFLEEAEKKKPKIFCAYHVGAYRGVIGILAKAGVDMAMLVDTPTYIKQKDEIIRTIALINRQSGHNSRIEVLDAESPDIGREMARALLSGLSIVAYLDGNSGAGGIYKRGPKSLRLPFMNMEIFSRTGLAMASYAMRAPVVPIMSYYHTEGEVRLPKYHCFDPIAPSATPVPMQTYVAQTTKKLYDILDTYLRRYVDQWESWLYVHKFLDFEALEEQYKQAQATAYEHRIISDKLVFNKAHYGLFRLNEDPYLMNKLTYKTHKLQEGYYTLLKGLSDPTPLTSLPAALTEATRDELLRQGILTYSA
jgi:lauroyl/myristoyl acyltransferase